MPPKIVNNKPDPRLPIAMNMMADLFLRSITRFSPLSKLPKLTAVDERLKERALQAIQAKSPEDRKISLTKVSQLGPGNLWKGLDLVPQRNSKSPGNQQRLQTSVNQSPLNPQQRRYQTVQNNLKIQAQPETRIIQNSTKKPIQRNHNLAAQNNLNDSRNIGTKKQVTGNIVSQNLVRNQKSIRDDFGLNDKSAGKKRKYSNENDKSLNVNSTGKNGNRIMTESRALHENKEKRVSFSPEKPREHSIDKKQVVQVKKAIQANPSPALTPKAINARQQNQQPYVYIPPTKRDPRNSQEKSEEKHHSSNPQKTQIVNVNALSKTPVSQSLSPDPVKEQAKKSVPTPIAPVVTQGSSPQFKIKSREQILAEQEKSRKSTIVSPPAASSAGYVYQTALKTLPKPEQPKIQVKKTVPEIQPQSPIYKPQPNVQLTQTSPKKVGFNISENTQNKVQTSVDFQKPAIKAPIHRTVVNQQKTEIKTNISIIKSPQANTNEKINVSFDISARSKSPHKQEASYKVIQRKKIDVSVEEMQKDWSKIKENLKYDRSYSPSNTDKKNIPERQDIAMKMLAQLFLDASTRYFPGLSMLLKRGISQEDIEKFRSKSSEFKINISTVDRKSPVKPQPKTDRKLNWKENSEIEKSKQQQNNRPFQTDVTAIQYKVKKPEEIVAEKQKTDQSSTFNKSKVQANQRGSNIVSESLEKNNKRVTRDDSNINKNQRAPSQTSISIKESPDVYRRETSRKELEDSKKSLEKMKNESSKSQYVYQPSAKIPEPIVPSVKKIQEKLVQKMATITKPEPIMVKSVKKQETKPYTVPIVIKQEPRKPQIITNKNDTSKTSINITQPKPQIRAVAKSPTYNNASTIKKQQQASYIYQPPTKWQPRNNSPPKDIQLSKPVVQPVNIQRPSVPALQKPEVKPVVSKQQSSRQIVQSRSQTNIAQPQKPAVVQPLKPVVAQPIKPVVTQPIKQIAEEKNNVNYGQKSQQNQEVKPTPKPYYVKQQQEKKPQTTSNNSIKNVSIISSKSQTSLTQPGQQNKKAPILPAKPQQTVYQPPTKKQTTNNQSGYVYQPSNKKDTNIMTQTIIPAKSDTIKTLRNVQSQSALKTYDQKDKPQENPMTKRDQKFIHANVETPKNDQSSVTIAKSPQPTVHKKQQRQPLKKSEVKEVNLLSKRFANMIALLLKRRLSSNYAYSLQKIQQKAKRRSEVLKHASLLSRSLVNFVQKYQKTLFRNAFSLIKSKVVVQVNKIIKENKPVQENQIFSSGRKQSASKIIFYLLNSKISSYFQPLRKLYLDVSNKGKVKQNVINAMARVFQKRQIIYKKDALKAIKLYKNQRQAVLSMMAVILKKSNQTAVSSTFSTLVSNGIKQLAATIKTSKQTSSTQLGSKPSNLNEAQQTLQKSRSQEILSSGKLTKTESEVVEYQNFSPADLAKLQSKRKQLERKVNDLENRKQSLQQESNNLNKDKRQRTKKNGDLKLRHKEIQKELENQEANQVQEPQSPKTKSKKKVTSLSEAELIPVLTRIYAYLFEDPENTQIVVERFLSDNQHCFQLPTNSALMNEWKVINKNAELKRLIKLYEGQQPREKRIGEVLQEENQLMGKLLRSFVRERYIWEWVNIIAHE